MKKIIIANWKANPDSLVEAIKMAQAIERGLPNEKNVEMVIAPPFPFLPALGKALKKNKLGAQDVFWEPHGPFTGEVGWSQIKKMGVDYVIVGHSERKIFLGETIDMINKKVRAALKAYLKTILCIDEKERESGSISVTLGEKLRQSLAGVGKNNLKNLIIAYEPLWAISTMPHAHPCSPQNVFEASLYIRKVLTKMYDRRSADKVRIIYGGSVTAENITSFLKEGAMDGVLVGGASLEPKEFIEIVKGATR